MINTTYKITIALLIGLLLSGSGSVLAEEDTSSPTPEPTVESTPASTPEPTPEPTPSPQESPPGDSAVEASPTPEPEPPESPTPEPSPELTPEATESTPAGPTPEPSPTHTPEPVFTPPPSPSSIPSTPALTPTPMPPPTPAPTPDPFTTPGKVSYSVLMQDGTPPSFPVFVTFVGVGGKNYGGRTDANGGIKATMPSGRYYTEFLVLHHGYKVSGDGPSFFLEPGEERNLGAITLKAKGSEPEADALMAYVEKTAQTEGGVAKILALIVKLLVQILDEIRALRN